MQIPVNVTNVLRLVVRTTKAVNIDGVAFFRDWRGKEDTKPFHFSSLDAISNNILGGTNTKLITAFPADSSLLSVVLQMNTANVQTGECYVRVDILPDINSTIPMWQLIGGYLTSSNPISSDCKIVDSLSGIGAVRSDYFTQHLLAGNDATYRFTVPANVYYRLDTVFLLHTLTANGSKSVMQFRTVFDLSLLNGSKVLDGFIDSVELGINMFDTAGFLNSSDATHQWLSFPLASLVMPPGAFFEVLQSEVAALISDHVAFRQWIAP